MVVPCGLVPLGCVYTVVSVPFILILPLVEDFSTLVASVRAWVELAWVFAEFQFVRSVDVIWTVELFWCELKSVIDDLFMDDNIPNTGELTRED